MSAISVWALIWIIVPLLVGFGIWAVFSAGKPGAQAVAGEKRTSSLP